MKLPRFFKTQKFYSLFSSVFNSAIALVTLGLLTRTLTREEFGQWAVFLTVYGFFEMALNGLIRTPVIRMAANDQEYRYAEVLASAWDILIKTVLVFGTLISLGFVVANQVTGDEIYFRIAYWFPLYCLLNLPQLIGMWNSNALMKFERIIIIKSTSVIIFLLGVIYLRLVGGGFELVFWFYLLASACASLLVLSRGWASFKCYLNQPRTYRKAILNFGKFSMGTTISATALTNSDALIIVYFLGPEALALYEIPKRIRGMYHIPLRGILQLTYPYLAKKMGRINSDEFKLEFQRILGFSFLALMPVTVLIFIFAEFLVTLLGGAEYAEAATILRVFALILFIAPFDRFSGLILDVLNRPNLNFTKVLIMLTVNIIGDIVAIKLGYGIVGVASVTMITNTAGIVYGFFMHRREAPFNLIAMFREGQFQFRLFFREFKYSLK